MKPTDYPSGLTMRERLAVRLRYGLENDGYPHTYAEIGRALGVSPGRAGSITGRAERKLAAVIRRMRGPRL